jgi:hypothetical protein
VLVLAGVLCLRRRSLRKQRVRDFQVSEAAGEQPGSGFGDGRETPAERYSDGKKVANRSVKVWHGATENGP